MKITLLAQNGALGIIKRSDFCGKWVELHRFSVMTLLPNVVPLVSKNKENYYLISINKNEENYYLISTLGQRKALPA